MERLVQYHPLEKTTRNSVNTFQCLNTVYITKLDHNGGNLNEAYNASFSNMDVLISGPDFKPTIRTKVPRTVMQYSYISAFFCHSGLTYKTVHPFRNFLSVLSPPPPHIQCWKSEKILDTRVQHCLWGEDSLIPTDLARLIRCLLYSQTRKQRNKNINGTKINVQNPALYKLRQWMKTKCFIQAQWKSLWLKQQFMKSDQKCNCSVSNAGLCLDRSVISSHSALRSSTDHHRKLWC